MATADRERWDRRHRASSGLPPGPPAWLDRVGTLLPERGVALDLACGRGGVALWLARRGLEVTAADISPVALGLVREAARREGLQLRTLEIDLDEDPLPRGPWDLIACFHYLQRGLFPELKTALKPGGVLVAEIATLANLERHHRPPAAYLLAQGELARLCAPLHLDLYDEGWHDDRAVARTVAGRERDGG